LIVDGDEYTRDVTFVVLACALMKPCIEFRHPERKS